jgi:hypothetical protein
MQRTCPSRARQFTRATSGYVKCSRSLKSRCRDSSCGKYSSNSSCKGKGRRVTMTDTQGERTENASESESNPLHYRSVLLQPRDQLGLDYRGVNLRSDQQNRSPPRTAGIPETCIFPPQKRVGNCCPEWFRGSSARSRAP